MRIACASGDVLGGHNLGYADLTELNFGNTDCTKICTNNIHSSANLSFYDSSNIMSEGNPTAYGSPAYLPMATQQASVNLPYIFPAQASEIIDPI